MSSLNFACFIAALLCAQVAGHGWLVYPEPAGFNGNANDQNNADTSSPCGKGTDGLPYGTPTTVFNPSTLTTEARIGGGHTGPNPDFCRFSLSADPSDTAQFAANQLHEGPCPVGTNRPNITITWTGPETAVYLQWMWQSGSGTAWSACSALSLLDSGITIVPLSSGAQHDGAATAGESDYYSFEIPAGSFSSVSFTGPTGETTGIRVYVKTGSIATGENYDAQASTISTASGDISLCGAGTSAATGYVTVSGQSAATGAYTLTTSTYNAHLDFTVAAPQVSGDSTTSSKFYYTEAYSTFDKPKRVVAVKPSSDGGEIGINVSTDQCIQATPINTHSRAACADLTDAVGTRYIEVSSLSGQSISYDVSVELGTCAEFDASTASPVAMSLAVVGAALFALTF